MEPIWVILIIVLYFGVLIAIGAYTGRNANNEAFFLGNRRSPWYIVAFGMLGASLSGVTFISVPGMVGASQFSYLQLVLGYLLGYYVIANVLLPLYYRLNLTSIYTYLDGRFGFFSYKTGSVFFLISRLVGSSFRLYLVAAVLQVNVFNAWHVPFWVTVVITIVLIWIYTNRGGIKTIIWTDTLQTAVMLATVILCIIFIAKQMDLSFAQMVQTIRDSEYSRTWFFDDWNDKRHFVKQFFSGVFITIVMTGLDQDMMQKNLSCRNLGDAKKNMYWYGFAFLPVNLIFLSLGVLLFVFAHRNGIAIPAQSDDLFPIIATQGYLPKVVSVLFIIGIIAAAYSSADSALTALTTSFTVDILNLKGRSEDEQKTVRRRVHIAFSVLSALVIMVFRAVNDQSVINSIFTVAGYTYGPLLGLYAFGLFTKLDVKDKWVPLIAILSPIICYFLSKYSQEIFNGYRFGFELLMVNGFFTFMGLLAVSNRNRRVLHS
ncbi:MAG: sodium:solute symporter [Tenuifilaceae bacterium]|jgi:Na+/proline symporter|nr:sodium:solute symporter [Bacteroidales bacterium]MDI9516259.1 sodium:solute symporter [Bacteroidota bacterium]OQC64961.1 MAG: Sodium/glucose cotransporter [Bacteroidetes bacterium ADurb.Bin008]HNV80443.1 sodium:solute symporter [Tenuifilaceae bacterium]MZP82504.1 sodium:solute symporter [Bacteroidales bacterium]